jgi:hypothetical protein
MKLQRSILDLAGVSLFAIVAAVVFWRCWSLRRPADNPHDPTHTAFCDFQDVVYYPAKAALAGVNPYDARPAEDGGAYFSRFAAGNSFPVYAPLIFVFSLPFAVLPLAAAELLYWLLNVGLLLGLAYFLLRIGEFPCRPGTVAGLAALMLLSRPGHANFYFGAITLPMMLAALSAWTLADRRPWLAAVCLAISLIKPTFGGPLFILLLLRGTYRAAFGGLAIAAAANLAVMGAFLPQELISGHTFELLAANQAVTDSDPAVDPLKSASRIDFLMIIERLTGRHWPGYLRLLVSLTVLGIGGWHLRRLQSATDQNGPYTRAISAALASLTVGISIYHNIYDALLAAPVAVAASGILTVKRNQQAKLALPMLALIAVPALNYFSSKQFLAVVGQFQPSIGAALAQDGPWTFLCILNGLCLTLAWCLLILLIQRQTSAS